VLDLWTDLLDCLDLHAAGRRSDADNVTVFQGVSQQLDYHRVFGGQLLGQFIRAASLACPDKTVKSLHAVFAREGRAAEPVSYEATRQHEGRSFASLTITAHQPHAVLASSSVSMHTVEDGPENQDCQAVPALLDDTHRLDLDLILRETRSAEDLNAVTAGPPRSEPCSPRPSRLTASGSTGSSGSTAGFCSASTARCWHTGAALVAATSSPRMGRWSRPTPRKRYCAFATAANRPARNAKSFAYRTKHQF
jgi:hypothetical protein